MKQTITYLTITITVVFSVIFLKYWNSKPPLEVAKNFFHKNEQNLKELERHIKEKYLNNNDFQRESTIIFTKNGGISHPYIPHFKDAFIEDFYAQYSQIKEIKLERRLCNNNSKLNEPIFLIDCELADNVSIKFDDCMKDNFENFKNNRVEVVRLEENWQVFMEKSF